jgi:hypothetical protein
LNPAGSISVTRSGIVCGPLPSLSTLSVYWTDWPGLTLDGVTLFV